MKTKPSKMLIAGGLVLGAVLIASKGLASNAGFAPIVSPQRLRNDSSGGGSFGASRDGGTRAHNGTDLLVTPGQSIRTPFAATVVRYAIPYANDSRYSGVLLQGVGAMAAYQVKIFYLSPTVQPGQFLPQGAQVGTAQKISTKYGGGMKDHVHVEVYRNGTLINPATVLNIV